jgi:hypothetical protein
MLYRMLRIILFIFPYNNIFICRVHDINLSENRAILYFMGIEFPVAIKLEKLFYNHSIIYNLPKKDIVWVGFTLGQLFDSTIKKSKQEESVSIFNSDINDDIELGMVIVCLNRDGSLIYEDKKNQAIYKSQPIDVILNKNNLLKFSEKQLYYISFLAGLSFSRKYNKVFKRY